MVVETSAPVTAQNSDLVVEWFRRYAAGEPMDGLVSERLVAYGSPTFMYPIDSQDADERVAAMHADGLSLSLREILGADERGNVAYCGVWSRDEGSAGLFYAVGHMRGGRIAAVTYVDDRAQALDRLDGESDRVGVSQLSFRGTEPLAVRA